MNLRSVLVANKLVIVLKSVNYSTGRVVIEKNASLSMLVYSELFTGRKLDQSHHLLVKQSLKCPENK